MHCLCLKNKAWVVLVLEKKLKRIGDKVTKDTPLDDKLLCKDILAAAREAEGDELLVGAKLLKKLKQYQAEEGG